MNITNVLITGCSSGFGKLIAQTLATNGYKVYASMRAPESKNVNSRDELINFAEKNKLTLEVLDLDISSDNSVQSAVNTIMKSDGKIDIVVNNAGLGALGIVESFSMEQIHQVFEVNTYGPIRVNKAILPHMRSNKDGLIITISSTGGRLCVPFLGVYNASKFAIEAFIETSVYELSPLGIDQCIIEPGAFPSELHNKRLIPDNEACLDGYGEIAKAPDQAVDAMIQLMQSLEELPNPQEVADKVIELVNMEKGTRPLRSVVGEITTVGIREINDASTKCQSMFLKSLMPPNE